MQTKLAISEPGDEFEREADRVAEQVMRMPEARLRRTCACGGECPRCQAEKPAQGPARLQTKHVGSGGAGQAAVPPSVREALRSPGQSLDPEVRAFMEARFGQDFSRVRVHSGATAEQSARDVNASAYTVGRDMVFGAGSFAPGTSEGRRLIAHELAHVVQQAGPSAGVAIQRTPKKEDKVVPHHFAVLLVSDKDFVTLATAIAPGARVLHATSLDDLVKQLKAIKGPIGTLYFVAHMTEDGDLVFSSPGNLTYVPAERVASKIKDSAKVESIDLRGCDVAQAPAEMDKIRVALTATKITGSTCGLVKQIADPIKIGGKAITQPQDLTDKNKAAFNTGLKKVRELFVDAKKKCIINDSVDGYFQTGGRLIAVWVNPGSMADPAGWDDTKSICYKDLKVEKVDPTKRLPVIGPDDCKLVEVVKKQP
ncbi:MAG TPA: DUF4157 domain-containing protein [Blastocatellia bacterium]|nr:DUF4157 domain-containing protein [Blastocatellia bacterium]